MAAPKTLIIGIGSAIGDDAIGWEVITAVEEAGLVKDDVRTLRLDRPGPALLDAWGQVERVILIDALRAGRSPGSVLRLARQSLDTSGADTSTHGFGVAQTLALAEAIGDLPRNLTIVGVEIGLTPLSKEQRAAALQEAVRQVEGLLRGSGDAWS